MISYRPVCKDPLSGYDVEVIYFCGKQQVYINLLLCPLEAPPESSVSFDYAFMEDTYIGKALLLEGGQRLLVDQEDADRLIEGWCSNKKITIHLAPL